MGALMPPAVPWRPRLAISLAFGALVGVFAAMRALADTEPRDMVQVWVAARVLLSGGNPYDVIGPGGSALDWAWPFYYPLPAALVFVPLALLPQWAAMGVFVAVGGSAFAWALMANGYWPLLALTSGCTLYATQRVQWSPLLAGAMALPALGIVFAAKPNIGMAIFAARPTWWPIGGGLVLCALAFAVQPTWLADWIGALRSTHVASGEAFRSRGPITLPGGVLVLVGLLRWRRPEARLLVMLACVPQTMTMYEAVPLFLVPRGRRECTFFTVVSSLIFIYAERHGPWPSTAARFAFKGMLMLWCLYLPALVMVLRRPNEGPLPAWLRGLSSLPKPREEVVGHLAARHEQHHEQYDEGDDEEGGFHAPN